MMVALIGADRVNLLGESFDFFIFTPFILLALFFNVLIFLFYLNKLNFKWLKSSSTILIIYILSIIVSIFFSIDFYVSIKRFVLLLFILLTIILILSYYSKKQIIEILIKASIIGSLIFYVFNFILAINWFTYYEISSSIINFDPDGYCNINEYPARWNEKHWVFRARDNNYKKNAKPLSDFKNIDNNIYVLDKKLPYTLVFTETGRWSCSVKNTDISFPYVERLKKLNANLILIKQSYKDAIMQAGEFGINNMQLPELAEYIKTLIPNTKKYVFYGERYNYFTSLYFASKIENSDCVSCIFYTKYESFVIGPPLLRIVKKEDKIPINLIQCIKDMQGTLHVRLAPYNEPSMEEVLNLHGHLNSKLNVTIFSLKDLLRWNKFAHNYLFRGCNNLFPLFASPVFKDWSLNRYLALPDH